MPRRLGKCATCQRLFYPRNAKNTYCSKRCMGAPLKRTIVLRCPVCRLEYKAGKTEKARKKSLYCSVRCGLLGRAKVTCNPLTAADAGYLAGLLDGEGSIVALKRPDGTVKSHRMHIANTHQGVLEWCQRVTGLGVIHVQTRPKFSLDPKRPEAHLNYKICYAWAVYGMKAASILRQLLPYLQIKRDRAVVALETLRP